MPRRDLDLHKEIRAGSEGLGDGALATALLDVCLPVRGRCAAGAGKSSVFERTGELHSSPPRLNMGVEMKVVPENLSTLLAKGRGFSSPSWLE